LKSTDEDKNELIELLKHQYKDNIIELEKSIVLKINID